MTLKRFQFPIVLTLFTIFSCKDTGSNNKGGLQKQEASKCEKSCCEQSRAKTINKTSENKSDSIHSSKSYLIPVKPDSSSNMKLIPGGYFLMGAEASKMALAREFPKHQVQVSSFYMDIHEVTNAQYAAFIEATGYQTVA